LVWIRLVLEQILGALEMVICTGALEMVICTGALEMVVYTLVALEQTLVGEVLRIDEVCLDMEKERQELQHTVIEVTISNFVHWIYIFLVVGIEDAWEMVDVTQGRGDVTQGKMGAAQCLVVKGLRHVDLK